jgi:hypothetical protein
LSAGLGGVSSRGTSWKSPDNMAESRVNGVQKHV